MRQVDFLPLGSVVRLVDATLPLMIVGRGLFVSYKGEQQYVDYAGVAYPEGLVGPGTVYFNEDAVDEVIHKGFSDASDDAAVRMMNEFLKNKEDLVLAHPETWGKE